LDRQHLLALRADWIRSSDGLSRQQGGGADSQVSGLFYHVSFFEFEDKSPTLLQSHIPQNTYTEPTSGTGLPPVKTSVTCAPIGAMSLDDAPAIPNWSPEAPLGP